MIRIDLNVGRCDALVSLEEIERRRRELPAPPFPKATRRGKRCTAKKPASSLTVPRWTLRWITGAFRKRRRGTTIERLLPCETLAVALSAWPGP